MDALTRLTEAPEYPAVLHADLEAVCDGTLELRSIDHQIGEAREIENRAYHPAVRRAAAALIRNLHAHSRSADN